MAGSLLPVKVNGVRVLFDPDSASDANIISTHHLKDLRNQGLHIKLRPVTKTFKAANGTYMVFEGFFNAKLSSASSEQDSKIYVAKMPQSEPPLLGEKSLFALGLIKYSPSGNFVKTINSEYSKPVLPAVKNLIKDTKLKQKFDDITLRYANCFDRPGRLKGYEVKLRLNSKAEEFFHRAISPPLHLIDAASKRLDEFVEAKILEKVPPHVPIKYCSSLLVIEKPHKKGEVRLVGHFVRLNKYFDRLVIKPYEKVEDFMSKMNGCKVFGKTDLVNGYQQLALSEESKQYVTVSTFKGNYRYCTLPQGLKQAQDVFDERILLLLAHVPHCVVNRDDVLFAAENLSELAKIYEMILAAFEAHNITCSSSKTVIGVEEISFHGYIFTASGIKADPRKVECLSNCKRPINQKGLTSFVCTVGWNQRFIHRFSEEAQPLRLLANTKGQMEWKDIHEKSFNYLKSALVKNCLNSYFIKDRQTALFTDSGKKTSQS